MLGGHPRQIVRLVGAERLAGNMAGCWGETVAWLYSNNGHEPHDKLEDDRYQSLSELLSELSRRRRLLLCDFFLECFSFLSRLRFLSSFFSFRRFFSC